MACLILLSSPISIIFSKMYIKINNSQVCKQTKQNKILFYTSHNYLHKKRQVEIDFKTKAIKRAKEVH